LAKEPQQTRDYFRSAFEHERKAAEMLEDAYEYEPTRSVLYRSAASLAWSCQDYVEAERLARKGLEGRPPGQIAHELKELLDLIQRKESSPQAP